MGAGHSWRKLNGDQGDRRANKLPDMSVRVHQAHDITGLSSVPSLASTVANVWRGIFPSISRLQAGNGSRGPINGPLAGHRVYSLAKVNTITADIPFGTRRNGS
jgi:hypothetical protein